MTAGLGRGLGATGVRAGIGGSLAGGAGISTWAGRSAGPGGGGTRRGQTGGSWTLTTAERPPCTTASASFSTWGSSAGSDTVTP